MMTLLTQLLDDPVMAMWFLLSALFFFLALFAFRVWLDIKGIRGIAIVTLVVSCGLLTMLLGVSRSPEARIPWQMVTIGLRPLFVLMLLSVGVIVDMWAGDHNDHRSVTTITYQFFKRLGRERDNRVDDSHRAVLHGGD